MDIIPISIIAVLLLSLFEARLSSKWHPVYFNKGLKLYEKETVNAELTADKLDETVHSLNKSFEGNGFSQSVLFYKIDNNTILFREKMFEFSLFNYTPLMHGKISVKNSSFKVTGIANWFPIAFLVLWYSSILRTFNPNIDFMFIVFPAIIFGVIYIFQSKKYNKVISSIT